MDTNTHSSEKVDTDNLPIVNLDRSVIKINEDYCDTCSGDKIEKLPSTGCHDQETVNVTCFKKLKKDSYRFFFKLGNKVKKCCQKMSFIKKNDVINLKEFEDTSTDEISNTANTVDL